jgi:hypothetical protein
MGYVYEFGDIQEQEMFAYDLMMEDYSIEFNKESK